MISDQACTHASGASPMAGSSMQNACQGATMSEWPRHVIASRPLKGLIGRCQVPHTCLPSPKPNRGHSRYRPCMTGNQSVLMPCHRQDTELCQRAQAGAHRIDVHAGQGVHDGGTSQQEHGGDQDVGHDAEDEEGDVGRPAPTRICSAQQIRIPSHFRLLTHHLERAKSTAGTAQHRMEWMRCCSGVRQDGPGAPCVAQRLLIAGCRRTY